MRSTLLAPLLAVAALAFVAAPEARAQYVYGYYPPVYSYGAAYYPGYYGYYAPSYYWYGNYYRAPLYRGWSYGAYNPYTNQYFYQYRVSPRRWRW